MKKMFFVLGLVGLLFASGCGGGGGDSGISIPTLNTSVSGTMTVPAVTASGLTTDIALTNDAGLLENFAKSAICTVNGKQMAFSLATATRYFSIKDITPAEKYDIQFTLKNFTLRAMPGHTSTTIIKNVDLNSTAEALLLEEYIKNQGLTATKIKYFEINPVYKDDLAQKMLTWLQTPTNTKDTYQTALSNELASYSLNVTPEALGSDLTPARDLTGIWKGTNVVYYDMNIYGERMAKITADITFTLKQSGSGITGVIDTTITKVERLTDLFVPPSGMNSRITGKVSSVNLTFTGYNFSGAFTFTSDLMQGTFKNTDLDSFLGIESDTNAIKLIRQK